MGALLDAIKWWRGYRFAGRCKSALDSGQANKSQILEAVGKQDGYAGDNDLPFRRGFKDRFIEFGKQDCASSKCNWKTYGLRSYNQGWCVAFEESRRKGWNNESLERCYVEILASQRGMSVDQFRAKFEISPVGVAPIRNSPQR